MELDI